MRLLEKSIVIYAKHKLDYYVMVSNLVLCEAMIKKGDIQLASEKLAEIENKMTGHLHSEELISLYQLATDVYEKLNNYKLAFKYGKTLRTHQLEFSDKKNGLKVLKLEYEQKIKDRDLEKVIFTEQQKQQKRIYILIIIITVLILIFVAIILFKQLIAKRKLSVLANTDVLTGAPNRRAILNEAELQLFYCQQRNFPLTIAIVDIDFFKSVNDDFGHDVGDEALKFFAKNASHAIRKSEYSGRFGGEEWLFVLPQTEVEFTQTLFDRLSKAVSVKNDYFDLGERNLTFSMGATQFAEGDSIKTMVDRGDKLLYEAKENGRDRLCY